MDWIIIVVAYFLGILGALTMISQVIIELQTPKKWRALRESRRSFIVLLTSTIGGIIAGTWAFWKSQEKKRQRKLLYDLEVKLRQLEGLVYSALSDTTPLRSLKLLEQLIGYLGSYSKKVKGVLNILMPLDNQLYNDLTKHLAPIVREINAIDVSKINDAYKVSFPIMLENLASMLTIVKSQLIELE